MLRFNPQRGWPEQVHVAPAATETISVARRAVAVRANW
jgi:hypothetical protein